MARTGAVLRRCSAAGDAGSRASRARAAHVATCRRRRRNPRARAGRRAPQHRAAGDPDAPPPAATTPLRRARVRPLARRRSPGDRRTARLRPRRSPSSRTTRSCSSAASAIADASRASRSTRGHRVPPRFAVQGVRDRADRHAGDDGVLSWDTKVADVLPTFTLADAAAQRSSLTVADILSHRVGLPHNTYDRTARSGRAVRAARRPAREVPMTCPRRRLLRLPEHRLQPDRRRHLRGRPATSSTHQVEKRIFHPLGMDTATYGRDALEGTQELGAAARRAGSGWAPFDAEAKPTTTCRPRPASTPASATWSNG